MSTVIDIISTLMKRVASASTHPVAVVLRAIDLYLDHRQLTLNSECYPPNVPSPTVPEGLVPLELLAWLPPQRPLAPPGMTLFGSTFSDLFNFTEATMKEHIGASAALEPLAREAHTMRVIRDMRFDLCQRVYAIWEADMQSDSPIPAAYYTVPYPPPAPRITPLDEHEFEQARAALGLETPDGHAVALPFDTLDAAVTILSSCRSLRDLQSLIFAFPHWAPACVFVTEVRFQTRSQKRQAQAGALFDRLPNLHRLSLDAALRNDAQPRLPASRLTEAVFYLGDGALWSDQRAHLTLAAIGAERVRDLRFENVSECALLAPLYCCDMDDRPTETYYLWNGKGFNAGVSLQSRHMRRLHGLSDRDDAVVFSPRAKSAMTRLRVSNIIRDSALDAIVRTPMPELEELEVVLHPGDREVLGHLRMLEYRGRRWKRCPKLRVLKLSVLDTGAKYNTPIGPVHLSASEVRAFMKAIASRVLKLELSNVGVPGWKN